MLRFLLLTLVRLNEAGGASRREIDLKGAAWTISAERTKNGEPHVMPLSIQAAALLTAMRPNDPKPAAPVFATDARTALGNRDRETKALQDKSKTAIGIDTICGAREPRCRPRGPVGRSLRQSLTLWWIHIGWEEAKLLVVLEYPGVCFASGQVRGRT
jgi:integrase